MVKMREKFWPRLAALVLGLCLCVMACLSLSGCAPKESGQTNASGSAAGGEESSQNGGQNGSADKAGDQTDIAGQITAAKEPVEEIGQYVLRDNDSLYADDDETSVVTMYLTVRRGNAADKTDHSWEEINTYSAYDYDAMGTDRYQVEALLQVGDENGPLPGEVGYGQTTPNATVQIRGQTSSRNAQKSYKVKLKDGKGSWRGQRTLNLNKHQTDGLRFRNKLGYDLLKGIPQTMSLRTQFVHLYVKDETDGTPGEFVDYGLYTQVEQLNKTGMRSHGLDTNGHLYKVNACEFYRYEDEIRLVTDPKFDEKAFERLLECKGNNDHAKLIQLLEEINDNSIPTEELLERHFNTENLAYWMAYHILTANTDTQNRNMYIYSPKNSQVWYFISWDLDAAFKRLEFEKKGHVDSQSWETGISNYWGNVLFRRCLKSERFRTELDAAILDLRSYLSEERLSSMIEDYRQVVEPYLQRMPDQMHEPLTPEEYDEIAKRLPEEVENSYQLYLESQKKPMPFFIGVPYVQGDKLKLTWDASYDFDAEDITYTVQVARDYDMEDVIFTYEGVWLETGMPLLETGQYFIKATATNASGYQQDAFDYFNARYGKAFGVKCFYVLPDGTIGEDVYEE